jgi:hypothetical protein
MSCPNCGAASTFGLNYCKQCGSNLLQPPVSSDQRANLPKLTGMFWAIAVFGLVSLAILFGTAIPIVIVSSDHKLVMGIISLGSIVILGIAALLIKQLSRLITMVQNSQETSHRSPVRMGVPEAPLLAPPPTAISSVTEHTTRNFEPVNYKEPEAR